MVYEEKWILGRLGDVENKGEGGRGDRADLRRLHREEIFIETPSVYFGKRFPSFFYQD